MLKKGGAPKLTAMAVPEAMIGIFVLMVIMLFLIIFMARKHWCCFSFIRLRASKASDLESPLILDEVDTKDEVPQLPRKCDVERACYQNHENLQSPGAFDLIHEHQPSSTIPGLNKGLDFLVDLPVGEMLNLKRPLLIGHLTQSTATSTTDDDDGDGDDDGVLKQQIVPTFVDYQRSCLSLEVISGPSRGLGCYVQSVAATRHPLTLGRVSSDLLLKDAEVSGRHAMITWNVEKQKWEMRDMGSLNGTLLNSKPINHRDSGSRRWGNPFELSSGDIITLGTTSKICVHVTITTMDLAPFSVGIASDPMALRLGGKKLSMEDVYYCQWPLHGIDKFGLFCVFDGHGGASAASSVSKMLPLKICSALTDLQVRERVLSQCDASDVLRDVFLETEACINNYYEGCTATILLVWTIDDVNFFLQCANVGDSACLINIDGKVIKVSEDHRISSHAEWLRIGNSGEPLKDGETRLLGLNLSRMLGDKFLKQQDSRFLAEPYISQAIHLPLPSNSFSLLASDGLWDVMSGKKASALVLQARERYSEQGNVAEKVAGFLLAEARALRTKDNTTIIFLDFNANTKLFN